MPGSIRVVALIKDPPVRRRILEHLGRWAPLTTEPACRLALYSPHLPSVPDIEWSGASAKLLPRGRDFANGPRDFEFEGRRATAPAKPEKTCLQRGSRLPQRRARLIHLSLAVCWIIRAPRFEVISTTAFLKFTVQLARRSCGRRRAMASVVAVQPGSAA